MNDSILKLVSNARLFPFLFCLFLIACAKAPEPDPSIYRTSIFSWEASAMDPRQESQVAQALSSLLCQAIYQHVPRETPEPVVLEFLKHRREQGQDVYYLTGAAQWGLEPGAKHMKAAVMEAEAWNQKLDLKGGFRGIVWDVEPYLLDQWKEDPEGCFAQLADNLIQVYTLTRQKNLDSIVCIPNFYDHIESETLERLIRDGCDAIAVMNYDKTDEAEQIQTEVLLAQTHQKAVLHISELQKPGYHKLTEQNTYYLDGLQAVQDSWDHLSQTYPQAPLGFSWHYLKPAMELLEREP